MSDKKQSAKRKWKNALLAAALTASVILALPAWSVRPAEAAPGDQTPLNPDEKCTLTITCAGENPGEQGAITVDLYKVAGAVKEERYDAYTLDLMEDYEDDTISDLLAKATKMKRDEITGELITDPRVDGINAAYRELAQEVAKKALNVEKKIAEDKTESLVVGSSQLGCYKSANIDSDGKVVFAGLDQGMYLVVAHGTNMKPAQYIDFTDTNVADREAPVYYEEAGQQIVTKAYNKGYTYTYLPELISLPMRSSTEKAVEGSFTTSAADAWQYVVRAELKSEQDVQMASLKISKTFTNTDNLPVLSNAASAVFEIEAKIGNNVVYSNSVKISTNDDSKEVVLTDVIPVGATVTVEEVEAGAGYELVSPGIWEQTVTADPAVPGPIVLEASFINNYNGVSTGGGIITNSFEPGEDGWKWYQDGKEMQPGSLQATGQ